MIRVSRDRFYEILAEDKYIRKPQIEDPRERTSCPYYNVIDSTTDKIVGVYSDGSWENTFKVIIELVSKEDIMAHHQKMIDWKEWEIENLKIQNRNLKAFREASPEKRAEIERQAEIDKIRRENSPGLYQFLEDDIAIPYKQENFSVETIIEAIKEITNDTK